MSASVRSQDFNSRVNVDFNDFRVADWWITQHNIPREFAHVELNEITSVGISPIAPFSHQADIIQINAIYVAGTYFSKESLYASLLLFWALLLSSEALFHYWTLRQRVKRDAAKLQSLSDISAKYKVKAETDKLTGLSNREGLAQTLMAIEQSDTKSSYALLLIDVDHFKGLNDQFGHDVGDLVLEELAQSINRSIRSTDIVCRWGGEEFVVLFRYTKLQDVYPFAEKIRLEIARSSFAGTLELPIYVSIGAALMSVDDSFEKTFKLADQALYAAKRAGRNQTIMAPQRSGYNN
jgi:diguanylate cyclase (GGDEF)-like protein